MMLFRMPLRGLTVVCETKWDETKWKWKSVVCEMGICSLRNGNLYFAKWESVVCEMKICSLRNEHFLSRCVYSDILNRKFPPQKNRFALRGMRDVFEIV